MKYKSRLNDRKKKETGGKEGKKSTYGLLGVTTRYGGITGVCSRKAGERDKIERMR